MTLKEAKKVIRLFNKLEQDFNKLSKAIVDLDVVVHRPDEFIIDNEVLKVAVFKALKYMFEYQDEMESTDKNKVTYTSLWASAGQIRDAMLSEDLYPSELAESKRIYSEIGLILAKSGFSATKRCSFGILRLIERDKLESLLDSL